MRNRRVRDSVGEAELIPATNARDAKRNEK